MVQQPAGTRDDHFGMLQFLNLRLNPYPAVNRCTSHAGLATQDSDSLMNLFGQLAVGRRSARERNAATPTIRFSIGRTNAAVFPVPV